MAEWVVNVFHLPMVGSDSAAVDGWAAVRAACMDDRVSDPFLLCGPGEFVMTEQREGMPVLNRGLLWDVEAGPAARVGGVYLDRVREMLERMAYVDPLSFDLHVPLSVDKEEMLRALDCGALLGITHHLRTLYGNLAGLGGEHIGDVMIEHRGPVWGARPRFLATAPDAFRWGEVGTLIRDRLREPCPYEQRRG